jgi:hypothetical protein
MRQLHPTGDTGPAASADGWLVGELRRDIMFQADRAKQTLGEDRARGEEEFRQLLEHHPRDGMVYLRRGQARTAAGDAAGAVSDLQRAEALLPRPEWKQQARDARQKLLGQDNHAATTRPAASPAHARLTRWLSN